MSALLRAQRPLATVVVGLALPSPMAANAVEIEDLAAHVELERERHSIPSMAVAAVSGSDVLWATAFGHVDLGRGRPATADTRYRIGSVGKAFNALAILSSDCASDACLDRPLTELDPSFSFPGPGDNPVTLRALLSHSSGMVREPPVGHYLQAEPTTLAATVGSLDGTCRLFEPGTNTIKYSNAGIALSGRVLELLSRHDYGRAVRERVFGPAGMERAAVGVPDDTAGAVMRDRHGRDMTAPRFELGLYPAGDMVASANDLAAFMVALFGSLDASDDGAFDRVAVQRMLRPFGDLERPDWHMEVGLGLMLDGKFEGTRMVRHGGGVYGFSTELTLLPEDRLGVVVVSARGNTLSVAQSLAHHILRVLLAERRELPAPEYSPVPAPLFRRLDARLAELRAVQSSDIPEEWRPLIGYYGWEHGGVEILSDGKALFASVEGGSPDSMQPTGNGSFRFGKFDDYAYEFLTFVRDDATIVGLAVGAGKGVFLPRNGQQVGDVPPKFELPLLH